MAKREATSVAIEDRSNYLYRKNGYLYFRMADVRRSLVPLPSDESSLAFRIAYDKCLAERNGTVAPTPEIATPKIVSKPAGKLEAVQWNERVEFERGTVGRAITVYLGSPKFTNRATSTQYYYRRFCDEIRRALGECLMADLSLERVEKYCDEVKADRGPHIANVHLVLLANIWKACRKDKDFGIRDRTNPARDAERPLEDVVSIPYRPWTEEESEKFLTTAPSHLVLAHLLLHFGAQRGGDSMALQWADFDGVGFTVVPQKQGTDGDIPAYLHCPKPLLDALSAVPEREREGAILVNSFGKPWQDRGALTQAFRRHCERIGLRVPGVQKGRMTPHGLRKNAASEVASTLVGGITGVKAVSLHMSDKMAARYSAWAEKKAMNKKVVVAWDEQIEEKAKARVAKRRGGIKVV